LQAAVPENRIAEVDEPADVLPSIACRLVGVEPDLLVYDRLREELDQDVVASAPLAVQVVGDLVRLQEINEIRTRELAALIGVDVFGLAVSCDRFLQGFNVEVGVHRVGKSLGEDFSVVPVHHGHQEQKAAAHRRVGNVDCPIVVWLTIMQSAQNLRLDRVSWITLGVVGLLVDRLDTHLLHQSSDVAPSDARKAGAAQDVAQGPVAHERVIKMQAIHGRHQRQVGLSNRFGLVGRRLLGRVQQLRLAADRKFVGRGDHRFAPSNPTLVGTPYEKSFSRVSCPILACSRCRSAAESGGELPESNTASAPLRSSAFHCAICMPWTPCLVANSANGCSPRMATSESFASKSAEWLRRGLLTICSRHTGETSAQLSKAVTF
jgi:hypothetical protein